MTQNLAIVALFLATWTTMAMSKALCANTALPVVLDSVPTELSDPNNHWGLQIQTFVHDDKCSPDHRLVPSDAPTATGRNIEFNTTGGNFGIDICFNFNVLGSIRSNQTGCGKCHVLGYGRKNCENLRKNQFSGDYAVPADDSCLSQEMASVRATCWGNVADSRSGGPPKTQCGNIVQW